MKRILPKFFALLTLMPLGQNLIIRSSSILVTSSVLLNVQKANANDAYFYSKSAYQKFDNNDLNGAISDLTKLIEIDPNYHSGYSRRGYAKMILLQYEDAINDFSKAIEVKPDDILAYFNRGLSKQRSGDFVNAIIDFNKVVELDPLKFDTYTYRGDARAELKDYTNALIDYDKSIELNPRYGVAYFNRGFTKSTQMGLAKESIGDFTRAIELGLGNVAYVNRGIAKLKLKDNNGAINDFNQALKINKKDSFAYYNRGKAYSEKGKFKNAISDFLTVLDINQNRIPKSVVYRNLAVNYGKINDGKNLCLYLTKGSSLGDKKSEYIFNEVCK